MYKDLILWILEELGLDYVEVERSHGADYIHSINPILSENNMSFTFFFDGWCRSYNGMIDGKTRIHLKEVFRHNGYMKEYIEWIMQEHNIAIYNLNNYRSLLVKKALKENYSYKTFNKLKKMFGELYLSEADILGVNEVKTTNKEKFKVKSDKKKKKSSMKEIECRNYNKCKDYIESRGLEIIEGKIEPITLKFEKGFEIDGIAFRYPNGELSKYRLLNKGLRYVCKGRYDSFYEAQVCDDKSMCWILEGEICSESFSKAVENTVYAMHNVNSVNNGGLEQLKDYDKVVILVDNDKYNEVKEGLVNKVKAKYPNKEVVCFPKFKSNDKSLDFNSFYMEKGLEELKKHVDKLMELC